jgi:hypothetical protein
VVGQEEYEKVRRFTPLPFGLPTTLQGHLGETAPASSMYNIIPKLERTQLTPSPRLLQFTPTPPTAGLPAFPWSPLPPSRDSIIFTNPWAGSKIPWDA